MTFRDRLPLLIGLALLAIAVFFGAVVVGDGIRNRNTSNVITVTGSARKPIVSDFVVWDASVSSQADTPEAALKELTGWTAKVRSFLDDAGANADEATFNPVATETVHGPNGQCLGYRPNRVC